MTFRKFGVPEEPNVRLLTPPEYQTIHRWDDFVEKLAAHVPAGAGCACGVPGAGREWAEHVADTLLGHPREPNEG